MTPDTAQTIVERSGVRIARHPDGGLTVDGTLDDATAAALDLARATIRWAAFGAPVGVRWHRCDTCRRWQMTNRIKRCAMTPRCPGKMRRSFEEAPIVLGGEPATCHRAGCSATAVRATSAGQVLCRSCFSTMAAALFGEAS